MLRLHLLRLRVLWRRLRLGYSRDDLVLDVGSGHRPHPRADVLCDRHLLDDHERLGALVLDRPLVVGDLTALPFRDRSIGFLICQHVLEHVDDPARALGEMVRVARAGYIETPAPLWEKLVGRPYHYWVISRQGSRLVCVRKPEGYPDPGLLPVFERFAASGSAWAELTLEQFDDFYTAFPWRERIEYEVRGGPLPRPESSCDAGERESPPAPAAFGRRDAMVERLKPIARGLLRLLFARRRTIDLESIIACPACHGALTRAGDRYECRACRLSYPRRDGVPVLLTSEATSLGPPALGEAAGSPEPSDVDASHSLPLVTVVMAVRNEERHITEALEAVRGQDYPADRLEIVVADGDSEDRTVGLVARIAARDPRVRLLRNPQRRVAAGLNAAIRTARGDIIVRADGHCVLPVDYVSTCVAMLLGGGVDVAGGPVRAVGEGAMGRAVAIAMSSPFGVGGASFRWSAGSHGVRTVAHLPFIACRRGLAERVGLFDERFTRNQDDEFSDRVTRAGGRIVMHPGIAVDYRSRATLRGLWRQYFGYGYWKVRVIRKRGGLPSSPRHLAPAMLVLGLLGAAMHRAVTGESWLLVTALSPYLGFLAAGTMWSIWRRRDPAALLLPAALAVMHLAYGFGFVAAAVVPWPRAMRVEREGAHAA